MKNKKFFKEQTELTNTKTKIYKDYIGGYLPKLLMHFGKCLIVDLFCGAGKNGDSSGSPLLLLNRISSIL